ncbi:Hypothetical predicted protein [Octopus vulgaris]|uniref:Uncharacterized protein n=1 Tax=Octopus vulgaris TaxID=6645 RepID=A0AA36FF65_OCTVU|nr:Hypothetical predicted protein [Octopus vulgaris]
MRINVVEKRWLGFEHQLLHVVFPSVEIPTPAFVRLLFLEDIDQEEKLRGSNDPDSEIDNDSPCKAFDQHKLNDLGLLEEMRIPVYNSAEWRLFNDCSKRSLKCVLLHTGNLFDVVPIEHLVRSREVCGDIKRVIELSHNPKQNWTICVRFLLG